jgi:hypothetical protein
MNIRMRIIGSFTGSTRNKGVSPPPSHREAATGKFSEKVMKYQLSGKPGSHEQHKNI